MDGDKKSGYEDELALFLEMQYGKMHEGKLDSSILCISNTG